MAKRFILKVRLVLAALALALPPLALIVLGAGALLFQRNALDLQTSLTVLAVAASIGAAGIAALLSGRSAGWISWRWMLLLALPAAAPLATAGWAAHWLQQHPSSPDISTDLIDPPALGGVATPLAAGTAQVQTALHPQVRSLTLSQSTEAAYERALSLAQAMGWTVTEASPPDGVIEGEGRFGRFGYSRRWTIRIRPELRGGALVDMRLRSRPEEPDFGQNAEVVEAFLKRLHAEAA